MLSKGSTAYLVEAASDGQRRLLPGLVADASQTHCHITFPPLKADFATEGNINLLYERAGRLFQRGGQIVERTDARENTDANDPTIATEPKVVSTTIQMLYVGAEVSADSRGSYRVSTAAMDLIARFENERECRVLDVSSEGMAIIVDKPLRIGTLGRLRFMHDGIELDGRARVQSVRPRGGEEYRCGLLVPSNERATRLTLQKLTASLQRAQLQRLRMSA